MDVRVRELISRDVAPAFAKCHRESKENRDLKGAEKGGGCRKGLMLDWYTY